MTIALVRAHTPGQNKSASTTVSAAIVTASVPAGSLLVAAVAFDNTSATAPTVTGISKPGGETNNWTIFQGANSPDATSGGGIRIAMAFIITTTTWNVAQTVVATLSGSVTAKAIAVQQFSGTGFIFVDDVISAASTAGTPSVVLPSASTGAGYLAVGMAGFENSGTPTSDSDTTNGSWGTAAGIGTTGGGGTTNITVGMQHKVMTAAGDQTYNPAMSQDAMAIIMSFREPQALAATVTIPVTSAVSATPNVPAQTVLELDAGNTSSYPGSGTTWTDLAGTASNFTLSGSPAFDSDGGGSLVFGSGKSAASATESTLDMSGAFSIDAWVKPADTTGSAALFARDIGLDGYGLRWAGGEWRAYGNGNQSASAVGNVAAWQHIVAVFKGTGTELWINNVLIDANSPAIPAGSGAFISYISPGAETFNGKVGLLRVWDKALDSTKISSLYSAESARFASGPAQLPATVTIPVVSVTSFSPKARLAATMTTTDVVSTNIATPTKLTPATVTTVAVSAVVANAAAGKPATVTTVIVSAVIANAGVQAGAVQYPGTVIIPIVSTHAATGSRLTPATVIIPITSEDNASATKLSPSTVSTPVASTVVAGGTKLTPATAVTPIITTVAVTPTKLTSATAVTPIVTTVDAVAGQTTAGIQYPATVTIPIVSEDNASASLSRPASVTIPVISTTTAPNTIATLPASVTIPVVSEDNASGSKLSPATVTSAIISTLAANGTKLTPSTMTTAIVSSSSGTAILRAAGSTTIAIVSTSNASPTSLLPATAITPIVSGMIALASPSGAGFTLPIITTVGAVAGQLLAATATVAITSTVVTSPTKRTPATVATIVTSAITASPKQKMVASTLTQIGSGFAANAAAKMAAAVITPIISQTIANAFLVGSGTGIYIGTDEVVGIYVGDQPVLKVYYGTELVWSAS